MSITNNLTPGIHRKRWEMCTPFPGGATGTGFFCTGDKFGLIPNSNGLLYAINGVSAIWQYNFNEDAWNQLPNSGAGGTFGAGSCGEFLPISAMGGLITQTATAGSTNAITTSRDIRLNLKDIKIRVIDGTGMGYTGTITSNTIGTNSILTVTPSNSVAFDNTTKFQIFAGSVWFINAGTTSFVCYDRATNVWTSRSVTNLPATIGTGGMIVSTSSLISEVIESGTSTGTNTSTTIIDTNKSWYTNMWNNYQIRISAGTGIGQIRKISSTTTNTITVSSAWTIIPDETSIYNIEGDDDTLYFSGNNSVGLYKYSITSNTWVLLAPTVARAAAKGAGGMTEWIVNIPEWTIHTPSLYQQNGRYLYSFRGGASNALDIYDITENKWYNNRTYSNQLESFTTGSSSEYYRGNFIICKEGTGRFYNFDIKLNCIYGLCYNPYPESTVREGDKVWVYEYRSGNTKIPYLFQFRNNRDELHRMILIGL